MVEITVYTKPGCGECVRTKECLTKEGADFTVKEIDEDILTVAGVFTIQSAPIVVVFDSVHKTHHVFSGYQQRLLEFWSLEQAEDEKRKY